MLWDNYHTSIPQRERRGVLGLGLGASTAGSLGGCRVSAT